MTLRSPAGSLYLDHHCRLISLAFDAPVYLVGSALETLDFNDIDLRCVLDDGDPMFANELRSSLLGSVFSEWLILRTSLPIDFQFQSKTDSDSRDKARRQIGIPITTGAECALFDLPKTE